MTLIEGVDKMCLEDIGDFIKQKTGKIRSSEGGDETHKKRTGPAKFLPTFMISVITKVMTFVTSTLGINMSIIGMKKDAFGFGMVTSVGMLGYTDATAPFTRNCWLTEPSRTAIRWYQSTPFKKSQSQLKDKSKWRRC